MTPKVQVVGGCIDHKFVLVKACFKVKSVYKVSLREVLVVIIGEWSIKRAASGGSMLSTPGCSAGEDDQTHRFDQLHHAFEGQVPVFVMLKAFAGDSHIKKLVLERQLVAWADDVYAGAWAKVAADIERGLGKELPHAAVDVE